MIYSATCVNVGCISTKTLVGSTRIAYLAHHAHAFGMDIRDRSAWTAFARYAGMQPNHLKSGPTQTRF